MDKDKAPGYGGGGGLPPHSSRFPAFTAFSGDPSPSSSSQSVEESGNFGHAPPLDAGQFSHEISRMPDFPPRNPRHRRAHSEVLSLPDDISFFSDLGVVGPHDGPSLSDDADEDSFSAYLDIKKFNSSSSCASSSGLPGGEPSGPAAMAPPAPSQTENLASCSNERPRARHQHSQSMDGSSSVLLGSAGEGPTPAEMKNAMSAAKLADLALVDPKRAKRIWANRQSAARSKERKMRYIAELERKVQGLQTEATTMSSQLAMLQRDTNCLNAENNELKLRLQTMEQQVHLQDAINDALREEVQQLKLATGQLMPNGGLMMNFGPFGACQQFYHHNQAMQPLLAAQQFQQLQIHSLHQQQLHPLQLLHQQQLHPLQPHQQQQQQQQTPVGLRMKGPMTSQNQRGESSSGNNNSNWKE